MFFAGIGKKPQDKRLREMGINPNGDQAEILLLMAEKMAAIEATEEAWMKNRQK